MSILYKAKRQFDQYETNRKDTINARERKQTQFKKTTKLINDEVSSLDKSAGPALSGGSLYTRMYYPTKKKVKL